MKKYFSLGIKLGLTAGLLLSVSWGQTYFNANADGRVRPGNARSLALGEIGVSESLGSGNLFTNPALLGNSSTWYFDGSLLSKHILETRSYPMIDQFGDQVTANTYNIMESWQSTYAGGAVWSKGMFAVGLGTAPYWSPYYRYSEDVRGNRNSSNYNRDPLVGIFKLERSGLISENTVGFSGALSKLKLGVSLGFLTAANLNSTRGTVVITKDEALDTDTTNVQSMNYSLDKVATIYRLGMSFDVSPRFRLAFAMESGPEMTFKSAWEVPYFATTALYPGYLLVDTTTTYTQTLPEKMMLGFRLQPTNLMRTKAYFEVAYMDWSQFKISYADSLPGSGGYSTLLHQTLTFRGGVEHDLFNGMPFRAGLIYAGSPLARELDQTWVTLGSGYRWDALTLDTAIRLGKVNYKYPDLFPAAAETHTGNESVRETVTEFALTLSYGL